MSPLAHALVKVGCGFGAGLVAFLAGAWLGRSMEHRRALNAKIRRVLRAIDETQIGVTAENKLERDTTTTQHGE